jgi:hypothetical protein
MHVLYVVLLYMFIVCTVVAGYEVVISKNINTRQSMAVRRPKSLSNISAVYGRWANQNQTNRQLTTRQSGFTDQYHKVHLRLYS